MSLPPTVKALLERDRFGSDAGQEVVGEDDLFTARACAPLHACLPRRARLRRETPRCHRSRVCPSMRSPDPSHRARRRSVPASHETRQFTKLLSMRWTSARSTTQRSSSSDEVGSCSTCCRVPDRVARIVGGRSGGTPRVVRRAPAPRTDRRRRAALSQRALRGGARGPAGPVDLGSDARHRERLLGEPAVLYKEKINHKLPGGAGYSAHQDTRPRTRCSPTTCPPWWRSTTPTPTMAASRWSPGASTASCRWTTGLRRPVGRSLARLGAGRRARGHDALVPQPHATPQRSEPLVPRPQGALPHLQRRHAKATAAPSTTRPRPAAFAASEPGDRGVVSLDRRLRRTARREGRVHGARRTARAHVGERHTPVLTGLAHEAGAAPGHGRAVDDRGHVPEPRDVRDRGTATGARHRHQLGTPHRRLHPGVGARTRGPHAVRCVPRRRAIEPAVVGDQCLVGVMGAGAPTRTGPRTGRSRRALGRHARLHRRRRHASCELLAAIDASRPRRVAAQRARHRGARARSRQRRRTHRLPRDRRALRCGPRPPRLGRHRVDRRVRPRPGDRRRPRARRPAARRSARRGVELFALPEGSATVVCGDGATSTRRGGCPRSTASRAPRRPTRRRRSRGVLGVVRSRGAPSASQEMPTEPGTHGGPRTRTQVAVVTGGHPAARPARSRPLVAHRERRRLGADDRDAARARAPGRERTLARRDARASAVRRYEVASLDVVERRQDDANLSDRAGGDAFDGRPPGVQRVDAALRTFAASSARRSATRSSRSGRRSNAAHLGGRHDATLEAERRLAARREHDGVRGSVASRYRLAATCPPTSAATAGRAAAPRARGPSRRGRRRAAASTGLRRARASRGRAPDPRPAARRRRDGTSAAAPRTAGSGRGSGGRPRRRRRPTPATRRTSASTSAKRPDHNDAASAWRRGSPARRS